MTTLSQYELFMIEQAFVLAEQQLHTGGTVYPAAMISASNTFHAIPAAAFSTNADKDSFAALVRALSIIYRADMLVVISECWTLADAASAADQAQLREIQARGGSLQEHAKAIEAVMVKFVSHAGTALALRRIRRPNPDWIELDPMAPLQFETGTTRSESRFGGLLASREQQADTAQRATAQRFAEMQGLAFELITDAKPRADHHH